jgi:hypothetical protein
MDALVLIMDTDTARHTGNDGENLVMQEWFMTEGLRRALMRGDCLARQQYAQRKGATATWRAAECAVCIGEGGTDAGVGSKRESSFFCRASSSLATSTNFTTGDGRCSTGSSWKKTSIANCAVMKRYIIKTELGTTIELATWSFGRRAILLARKFQTSLHSLDQLSLSMGEYIGKKLLNAMGGPR